MNLVLQALLHFWQVRWVELVSAIFAIIGLLLIGGFCILKKNYDVLRQQEGRSHGLAQVIVDVFRLLLRFEVAPSDADQFTFLFVPMLFFLVAVVPLSAVCCGPPFRTAGDIDIGILFVVSIGFLGFLGAILAGWGSSKSFSGSAAMRNAARFLSFQVVAGFAIVSALVLAGSLRMQAVVNAQATEQVWFVFLAPMGFLMTVVAAMFGTNRRLFELPETELQSAAGSSSEYRGLRSTLYLIGEFAGMVIVASIGVTLFLGGWLRPFPNVRWMGWLELLPGLLLAGLGARCIYRAKKSLWKVQGQFLWIAGSACVAAAVAFLLAWTYSPLRSTLPGLNATFWFALKLVFYLRVFVWLRSTLPLFRFDQLMHLCWRILVPLSILSIFFVALATLFASEFGYRWLSAAVGNVLTFVAALFLLHLNDRRTAAAHALPVGISHVG